MRKQIHKNLPSLFESDQLIIEPWPPAASHKPLRDKNPELDADRGKLNRDKGIKKAITHANKKNKGWLDKAYNFLLIFLNNHNGNFMCEEVRVFAEGMGFEIPPTKKAWGGVFQKASKQKDPIIKKVGLKSVRNPKANMANAGVWMAVKNYN